MSGLKALVLSNLEIKQLNSVIVFKLKVLLKGKAKVIDGEKEKQ